MAITYNTNRYRTVSGQKYYLSIDETDESYSVHSYEFNADFDYKHKNCMTSIIYINTNNGYTKFKNGDIVESIRNRLVTFPAHLKYADSTCTDEEYRCIINLNYYK